MDNSPFGRLPRELRDLIYEHAVVHDDGIRITSITENEGRYCKGLKIARPPGYSRNATLALAMTCRQLHRETINLYYERSSFYFELNSVSVETVSLFSSMLTSDYAKSLTRIIFDVPEGHYPRGHRRRFRDNWKTLVHQLVTHGSRLLAGPVVLDCQYIFDRATIVPFRFYEARCFGISLLLSGDEEAIKENLGAAAQIRKCAGRYWTNARFFYPDVDGNVDCIYCPYARLELRKGLA